MLNKVIGLHEYTQKQEQAVKSIDQNMVVTAGAGTGKTRTLVGRYLALLSQKIWPSNIAAITFTEKAAREMRNRIRQDLRALQEGASAQDQAFWQRYEGQIDAARIGTIHSLCAEILKAHPAEAGIDPRYEVVAEGWAAVMKKEAVEAGLAFAVEDPEISAVYNLIEARQLRLVLAGLLDKRLEAKTARSILVDPQSLLQNILETFLSNPAVSERLAYLREMQKTDQLVEDVNENFAPKIINFLNLWKEAESYIKSEDLFKAASLVHDIRNKHMNMQGGKTSSLAKGAYQEFRDYLDTELKVILGKDGPPTLEVEKRSQELIQIVWNLYDHVEMNYQQSLEDRQALDFDDLEYRTLEVLQNKDVASYWQGLISYVLVDEYQDTNQRQREIINIVTGGQDNKLFVVGDARQSIYKFRGADVSVFQQTQHDIQKGGGEFIELDTTFRYHQPLSDCLTSLLEPIMNYGDGGIKPYQITYTKLNADRTAPLKEIQRPLVEFIVAEVDETSKGRDVAARALIKRLMKMYAEQEIRSWDDVAILSRAARGFIAYEKALNEAKIPFITTAGQGFYDRPEIRDILNILKALSDPWDDLAITGLLRSPAIGLSDEALFLIRNTDVGLVSFQKAFQNEGAGLEKQDSLRFQKARAFIEEFQPLANQLRVADLLKQVIDRLDYRAILISQGGRSVRNADKLLEEALSSDLVQINTFLEYIYSIRDVGAREGEAPTVSENSVRLMTVHKSKGLEFKLIVLADAQRSSPNFTGPLLLDDHYGMSLKLRNSDSQALIYNFAYDFERERSAAETDRLLYVALTRAQEKVLVNGYIQSGKKPRGWLKQLCDSIGWTFDQPVDENAGNEEIGIHITNDTDLSDEIYERIEETVSSSTKARKLYKPFELPAPLIEMDLDVEEEEISLKTWRATGKKLHPPAVVVGKLFHKAIERWAFPSDEHFLEFMISLAIKEGVINREQRVALVDEVSKLLSRFQSHPLFEEISASPEKYHELPYSALDVQGFTETGIIDLVFKQRDGSWLVVDFKTDEIKDEDRFYELLDKYKIQINRYRRISNELLGKTKSVAVFLDYDSEIKLEEW